jgi:hypothetical protein
MFGGRFLVCPSLPTAMLWISVKWALQRINVGKKSGFIDNFRRMLGSHSGDYEEDYLLGQRWPT